MRLSIACTITLLLSGCAAAQPSLCSRGEPVVFSCRVGTRLVSLCRPSPAHKSLLFRLGAAQAIELAYPNPTSTQPGEFSVSQAPLAGGGVTTVIFRQSGVEYRVYSQVSRGADESEPGQRVPIFEDGLEIRAAGEKPRRLVCDDGGAGFREEVDWLPTALN